MAVKLPVIDYGPDGNRNVVRVTWVLANTDTGSPVSFPEYPDKTFQITGTFGVGGSVTLEGSNFLTSETPVYAAMTDPQGNAITKTAAAVEVLEEAPLTVRPNCTAGDGTTALTVRLVCRRPR